MKFILEFLIALSILGGINSRSLSLDDNYHLNFHLSPNGSEIIFELSVKTKGYVGFGLSSNGAMTKADIVIGGVKDGEPYFNDYHGPDIDNSAPILDKVQNYKLLSYSEDDTHTNLSFSRLLETCDSEDIPITEAGLRLIWAIGSTDEIKYHGLTSRNAKSVYLLDPDIPVPDLSHLKTFDIKNTIKMPKKKTTYWCSIHRLPDLAKKHQMIAYEPIFGDDVSKKYAHHMNILKCFQRVNPDKMYGDWVGHEGVECDDNSQGFPGDTCIFLEYGWALGGELAVNPEDVGFPFESREYYKLEVHLNNPGGDEGVEVDVGFRIYYTDEIKKITGSLLMVSGPTNYQLMVPPNQGNFTAVAHCMPECTQFADFPKEGVTAYNAFLHAHTSARQMRIRHYRNGKELPWIINDENYDFNYQTNRRLPKPVTILPGDQITAECVYDTNWKEGKSVLGGSSTDDEMCMVFIAYHPAIPNFVGCYDWMDKRNMFKILGVDRVGLQGKDPVVLAPPSLKNKKFSEVVEAFNWTPETREAYQWEHQYGPHITTCLPRLELVTGYYPHVEPYESPNTCRKNEEEEDGDKDNGGILMRTSSLLLVFISILSVCYAM